MGRPKKERVEDEVGEENFGSNDFELFNQSVMDRLGGEILGDVCMPKGHGTGSIKLDIALTQAIPQGFLHEIYASNGVGKTTLALEICGQAQLAGCRVAYLDLEGTLNKTLVASIRTLDTNKVDSDGKPMWIYKEGLIKTKGSDDTKVMNGEEAFKYVDTYCSTFKNAYIIVDSVDSIIPAAILEGKDIGEATMGALGKLMTDGCRRLHGICKKNNNTVIFINQVRDSLKMYGAPETTPGGRALGFYTFSRLKLTKGSKDKLLKDSNGKVTGHPVTVSIIKNKLPNADDDIVFNLIYGRGIDRESEIIDIGMTFDLIKKWKEGEKEFKDMIDLKGNKVRISQAANFLYENPTVCKALEQEIRTFLEI